MSGAAEGLFLPLNIKNPPTIVMAMTAAVAPASTGFDVDSFRLSNLDGVDVFVDCSKAPVLANVPGGAGLGAG